MNVTNVDFKHDTNVFIHSQILEPNTKVKGVVVLVHGLGEHCGRYGTHFSKFFTGKGFAIVCFDLTGHGRSGGKKGDLNYADTFKKLVTSAVEFAKIKYPNLPVFIYGHSLGGLIALESIIKNQSAVNGAVISAPAIDVKEPIPSVKVALAKIMDKLLPSFSLDSGLNRNMLSRDKTVIEKYNADPLVHGLTSARLGSYIIDTGRFVAQNAAKVNIPTLVMVGSEEGIVSKDAIDTFCAHSMNCEKKVWAGLYHELHNEPEKEEVFNFVIKWMNDNS